jgi:hypothetical protein
MNKEKIILTSMQIVISAVGVWLIGDLKLVGGVLMLMWANNLDHLRLHAGEDINLSQNGTSSKRR